MGHGNPAVPILFIGYFVCNFYKLEIHILKNFKYCY